MQRYAALAAGGPAMDDSISAPTQELDPAGAPTAVQMGEADAFAASVALDVDGPPSRAQLRGLVKTGAEVEGPVSVTNAAAGERWMAKARAPGGAEFSKALAGLEAATIPAGVQLSRYESMSAEQEGVGEEVRVRSNGGLLKALLRRFLGNMLTLLVGCLILFAIVARFYRGA